jgi:hypothetical protein
MTKHTKQGHILPQEVLDTFTALSARTKGNEIERYAYIKALRERGWTLDSIGIAAGITRERVRQISNAAPMSEAIRVAASGYLIPEPPVIPEKTSPQFIEPTEETLKRLLELQPYAQQVRSYGKAYRKEAEEYTWLVNYAHTVENVTLYRLAKRLGVTHGALRFRLARYGYKTSPVGQSKAYTPILEENRINLRPVE